MAWNRTWSLLMVAHVPAALVVLYTGALVTEAALTGAVEVAELVDGTFVALFAAPLLLQAPVTTGTVRLLRGRSTRGWLTFGAVPMALVGAFFSSGGGESLLLGGPFLVAAGCSVAAGLRARREGASGLDALPELPERSDAGDV